MKSKWMAIAESALIVAGAAFAVGFLKRTKLAETVATKFGISEKQASLAGSLIRTAAPAVTLALVPASAPYSVPLFYASVSELASSSIKPA